MSLIDRALPAALAKLLRELFSDEESARRASLAPWPETDFRSAFDDRALWSNGARASERRALYEKLLTEHRDRFARDRPYFVVLGAQGTIFRRDPEVSVSAQELAVIFSPYPELSNAEFWLFLVFWGNREVDLALETWPAALLDYQPTVQYLRRWRGSGAISRMRRILHGQTRRDVLRRAWEAQQRWLLRSSDRPLADLDLPASLERLLQSLHSDEVSARRAALAPWLETGFRSALDDRALWSDGAHASEPRALYERLLTEHRDRFARDRPYFKMLDTEGTIASPYLELSHAEYWLFVVHWGNGDARRALENLPAVLLDIESTVRYLRRWHGSALLPRMRGLLGGRTRLDVLRRACEQERPRPSDKPVPELELPASLARLLQSLYSDGVSARRAALAPWPETDFRSAFDDRALWSDGAKATERRALYEKLLTEHRDRFARDQPYFASPGTEGTIVSPYPELSHAEYWLFVIVWWGTDELTRFVFARDPSVTLDIQTPEQYLRRWRASGLLPRMRRLLERRTRLDVLRRVWEAQGEIAHPVYF